MRKKPLDDKCGMDDKCYSKFFHDIEIEDYITARYYPFISGNQEATYLMVYWCPINSGACPRIDFIFDQDSKLMCIQMGAVYKKFVDQQVLDHAIPYQAE